jgi:hypothetical protein
MRLTFKILSFALTFILLESSLQGTTLDYVIMGSDNETVVNDTLDGPNNSSQSNYFFVQSSLSGSLTPINYNNTTENQVHKLILNNVSSSTLAFSDRPDRIVNLTETQTFIDNWNKGQDSFKNDPPNAVLSINVNGREEIFALELLNPKYDREQKTIQYEVINLDNTGSRNIILSNIGEGNDSNTNLSKSIGKFGVATLFIDTGCNPLDPRGC